MGAISTRAPHEKLKEGTGNSFLSRLWNSEVFDRYRAERCRITHSGLGCFDNPLGNDLGYRIVAVGQFKSAERVFIGRRKPLDVLRPEYRVFEQTIDRHRNPHSPGSNRWNLY
jgi:hypothetical protein